MRRSFEVACISGGSAGCGIDMFFDFGGIIDFYFNQNKTKKTIDSK